MFLWMVSLKRIIYDVVQEEEKEEEKESIITHQPNLCKDIL